MGTTVATRTSMHAMKVSVLGWARAHPRRPVLLYTKKNSSVIQTFSSFYTCGESCTTNLPVEVGYCWGLRPEVLLPGCWSVLHQMKGLEPLPAQP